MVSSLSISPKTEFITGNYGLTGVADTHSHIEFFADHTFEFNYSYSAISRKGKGTYTLNDNRLELRSKPDSKTDFMLASASQTASAGISIKISDADVLLKSLVACSLSTEEGILRTKVNEEGIAFFNTQNANTILLIHLLYPDRTSIFSIENKKHNCFEFTINPSIANIQFHNLELKRSGNELTGEHPLLEGRQFRYIKT